MMSETPTLTNNPARTVYLNRCGKINLRTGNSLYFNVFTEWDLFGANLTVIKRIGSSKGNDLRIIGGFGLEKVGTRYDLFTNTHKRISWDSWEVVEVVPCRRAECASLMSKHCIKSFQFYTFD